MMSLTAGWYRMLGASLLLSSMSVPAEAPLAACDQPEFAETQSAARPGPTQAQGVWMNTTTLLWPGRPANARYRIYHSASGSLQSRIGQKVTGGDGFLELRSLPQAASPTSPRFAYLGSGVQLQTANADAAGTAQQLRGQHWLVQEDSKGRVTAHTQLQVAAWLDAYYGQAASGETLGVTAAAQATGFRLWAPTAREVKLCLYRDDAAPAYASHALQRDPSSGSWHLSLPNALHGQYYTYLVLVQTPQGLIRNRVTDPYALSLGTDSKRSWIGNLDLPESKPEGWDQALRPAPLQHTVDMSIYELHVRDFSRFDASVPEPLRGKYLAFAEPESDGVEHLRALAAAGMTDIHLLPVFDLATIPERNCNAALTRDSGAGTRAQEALAAIRDQDCFNWGYDPWHFNAPEGSYATDASDGALRVREFRRMVQALHGHGLRVGMDVVYNHMSASGQNEKSVLDRIVPGYYHRLDANGNVTTSTCCANTATEHRMMAKLMIDSAVIWARDYRIDSFRFDLMGHQPRAAMEELQVAVDKASARRVQLIGEGWNFGEIANGARFVQASQLSLNGSGIATFSDRARDAARGGSPMDTGKSLVARQGFLSGLHTAPNAESGASSRAELMAAADLIRIGLAGTLRSYQMQGSDGTIKSLESFRYGADSAGYVTAPDEVVNYVENHDNQTLFDALVMKLPLATTGEERARVQHLGAALVTLSQGIAYFHAGQEILRSKSLDKNSYNSGDWFNRMDWRLEDNGFASGLPPQSDNGHSWEQMRPRLENAGLKATHADIAWTRDSFLDWLQIRKSSTLLRMRTAEDIKQRLRFFNTGPEQIASVVAAHINGRDYAGAGFEGLIYALNSDTHEHRLPLPDWATGHWQLHPVLANDQASDARVREAARFDAARRELVIPARSAAVWVPQQTAPQQTD